MMNPINIQLIKGQTFSHMQKWGMDAYVFNKGLQPRFSVEL